MVALAGHLAGVGWPHRQTPPRSLLFGNKQVPEHRQRAKFHTLTIPPLLGVTADPRRHCADDRSFRTTPDYFGISAGFAGALTEMASASV